MLLNLEESRICASMDSCRTICIKYKFLLYENNICILQILLLINNLDKLKQNPGRGLFEWCHNRVLIKKTNLFVFTSHIGNLSNNKRKCYSGVNFTLFNKGLLFVDKREPKDQALITFPRS